jgi:hypothetical protein
MSHIATALAKSKGRSVTPEKGSTPLGPTVSPLPVAEAPKPPAARKFPLPIVAGAVAALGVLAVGGWLFLRTPSESPQLPAAVKPAAPAPKPAPAATAPPPPAPSTTVKPTATATLPAPATPASTPSVATPAPDLQVQVRQLVVTGRMANPQRASINGKVYVPGDRVTDTLTLKTVERDRIVLSDGNGQLYYK